MPDQFKSYTASLDSPAAFFEAITPNDSSDLVNRTRFLLVGAAGNIALTDERGTTTTIAVQAGVLPLRPCACWPLAPLPPAWLRPGKP